MGGIVYSQKEYIKALTPSTCECYIIWKQGLYRSNQAKMMSLGGAQFQYDWYPYKKGKSGHRDSHIEREDAEKSHMQNVTHEDR